MHDPMVVRVAQRGSYIVGNPNNVLHGELAVPVQPLAQRVSLDEGHDIVQESLRFTGFVQGEDLGVLELRGEFDFLDEPLGAQGDGKLRPQHLDGDPSVELQVFCYIDRRHPASANLPLDGVAVGEGSFQAFEGVGHGAALRGGSTSKMGRAGSGGQRCSVMVD